MASAKVLLTASDGVMTATLNRPEKLNAIVLHHIALAGFQAAVATETEAQRALQG